MIRADRQRSRHTARIIDYSDRRTCGSVRRIPVRWPRPVAPWTCLLPSWTSPRKPPVIRVGGLTASSQTSNDPGDFTPRHPSPPAAKQFAESRYFRIQLLHRTGFDVSVSKSPGPGAAGIAFEAAPVGAKNAVNIVNSWKIVARPRTVSRLPPGYDNFDARGGPAGASDAPAPGNAGACFVDPIGDVLSVGGCGDVGERGGCVVHSGVVKQDPSDQPNCDVCGVHRTALPRAKGRLAEAGLAPLDITRRRQVLGSRHCVSDSPDGEGVQDRMQ